MSTTTLHQSAQLEALIYFEEELEKKLYRLSWTLIFKTMKWFHNKAEHNKSEIEWLEKQ